MGPVLWLPDPTLCEQCNMSLRCGMQMYLDDVFDDRSGMISSDCKIAQITGKG